MTWDAATHSSRFAAPAMVTPLLSPPPSPKPEPANGSSGSDGGLPHRFTAVMTSLPFVHPALVAGAS